MHMLVDDLYTTLQARFSGRLYPDVAPVDVIAGSNAFGTYQVISGVPETNMVGGAGGVAQYRVQVDAFARARRDVNTIADLLITDMDAAFKCGDVSRREVYEDEVEWYRTSIDFSVWK